MKRKLLKRILSLLIAMIIAFGFNLFVYAESIANSVENKIITVLQNTECIKDDMGLDGIDFCELYISNPINTYEFTNNGFVFLRKAYPLLIDNNIIALALELGSGVERTYQISTTFVDEINKIKNGTPLAIVYDKEGAYVFFDGHFYLLGLHSEKIIDRLNVCDFDMVKIDVDKLNLVEISNGKKLNYEAALSSRTTTYYECDVEYVTQNPHENICWAASCAMIINSVRDYHYTAVQVARRHYNNDFDHDLPFGDEVDVLADFSVVYTYNGLIKPSGGVMLHNIRYGWPIFAGFTNSDGGGHAVVIYGINVTSGYLYIMDPLVGARSASYNSANGYHYYVSDDSGGLMIFNYGTCHYWTAG